MLNYENFNIKDNSFAIYPAYDLTWNAHFHRAIEIIIVLNSEIICTVNNKEYTVTKDEAVMIMPNQIHSFQTEHTSKIQIIRFTPNLAGSFYKQYKDKIPADNHFIPVHPLPFSKNGSLSQPENLFELKGLIYTLLGDFCRCNKEWLPISDEKSLIYQLIMYIEENFKNSCSLKDAANSLKYDYTYISKEFLRVTGLTFVEYLNNCRINHACYLLENSDLTITQIAHESGYNTLRTFNRNFLKYANTTPAKYLKSKSIL